MVTRLRITSSGIGGIVCAGILAFCSVRLAAEEPGRDIYSLLSGEWGSNQAHTCESNPHVISFSDDKSRATFTYRYPPESASRSFGQPAEKISPEISSERTIHFHVLDHGDKWIALRRDGEKTMDRLRKPQTWKLNISKDHTRYRWWLYHSAARKKSPMRGIRCPPD